MQSNYALYIKEREGKEIFEDEKGYITYLIQNKECYIVDVFVRKEFRRDGVASYYGDIVTEIAKSLECEYITGSVCPSANGSTESMKFMIGYGFKLENSINDLIFFRKVIGE